jgi:tetratricopeptide (TPR) repeat protein
VRERYRSLSAALDKSLDATRVLTRALAGAKEGRCGRRSAWRSGEIFAELGDAKRAKVAFQQVLDARRRDAEALRATRALAKLATEAHDNRRRWRRRSGKLSEVAPDPEERARAAAELGRLYETELRDPQGAIDAWRKVLGTSREPDAITALARLYEATGAKKELAHVLERRAETARRPRSDGERCSMWPSCAGRSAIGARRSTRSGG